MKAQVDPNICIGCELCTSTAPDVFSMDGSVAVAINGEISADLESDTRTAKEECPVEAISIE